MARMYLIVRFLVTCFSDYRSSRNQRLCQMNGVDAGIFYAFKGMTKASPYTFVSTALLISIVIPGYCVRMFERPLMVVSL
jgi:hypothetical protein